MGRYHFYFLFIQAISITTVLSFSVTQKGIIGTNLHDNRVTSFQRRNNRRPNSCPLATSDNDNNNGVDNEFDVKDTPSPSKKKKGKSTSQFEIQELRGQLTAISKARIPPRNLTPEKRSELATYLRTILQNTASPIPLRSIGDNGARALHGSWRLGFTSSSGEDSADDGRDTLTAQRDLPKEAEVIITFYPDYKCDYILAFSKRVFLLQKLIANSSYIVDCSPLNPGLVSIIYQNIVTDVGGLKGLKVGLFGMLKGRVTYVETVWFDGIIWVERSFSAEGDEFFNIYVKEDDDVDI